MAVDGLKTSIECFVAELQQFKEHLLSWRKPPVAGLDRMLETQSKLLAAGVNDKPALQASLDMLKFDLALWNVVKRCRGLVALKQYYRADWDFVLDRPAGGGHGAGGEKSAVKVVHSHESRVKGQQVCIDAVVDAGATWIRLLTISERRLIFELAESSAWNSDCESDMEPDAEGSNAKPGPYHSLSDYTGIKVVRKAAAIVAAAKNQRFRYRRPRVHILLPMLKEGKIEQIDRVIAQIRQLGDDQITVVVDTGNGAFLRHVPDSPPIRTILSNLVVDELQHVTGTVNLDISWLIALSSDLSHECSLKPFAAGSCPGLSVGDAKTPAAIREACGQSLCETLYPSLAGRKLVCTSSAADRVWAIANTLATGTELERLRLVLPRTEADLATAKTLGPEGLRVKLADMSVYGVPVNIDLPINIIDDGFTRDVSGLIAAGRLPSAASAVAIRLKEPNRSIFLFGWATGHTTLTAHSAIANRIKRSLELNRQSSDDAGPDVFVRWATRSFDAKEKPDDWVSSRRRTSQTSVVDGY